jgi:hypothetical protein
MFQMNTVTMFLDIIHRLVFIQNTQCFRLTQTMFLDIIHRLVFIQNTQRFRDLILPLLHVESTNWANGHNEELHNLYYLPNINRMIT